jgi:hypothetical protein
LDTPITRAETASKHITRAECPSTHSVGFGERVLCYDITPTCGASLTRARVLHVGPKVGLHSHISMQVTASA